MVVSYGRTRLIRLAALACLACATFMTILQISRYARRPSHFSSPQNDNHLRTGPGQQQESDQDEVATTTRTQESLRADLNEYWANLTRAHNLQGDDVPVFVRRVVVPSPSGGGKVKGEGKGKGEGEGEGKGWMRAKSDFLPAHGFIRPAHRKSQEEEGEKKEQDFYWPLSGPLTLSLPSSSKPSKTGASSSSSLLLGVATSYSRISSSNFWLITNSWKQSLSNSGAGLIVALENGTEEERIEVRDELHRSRIDASVFVPQGKTDTDKGNVYAQLFQRMMMARFGVGELGAGKARKWFGIMDEDARLVGGLAGLVEGLDEGFGGKEEDGNGRWYIGFPTGKKEDWVDTTKGGGAMEMYGGDGAVMLMSQSVLDTAGQLMCFQGGGKGLSRHQQKMSWNELLYECLMEGDKDLKFHVLGDGGPGPADEDGDGGELLPQRPLVTKETGNGLDDAAMPPAVLFEDYWVVRPGKKVTYYPNGVEVKEEVKEGRRKTEWKKVSERVILHSPFPPGTKRERLVWKGKRKTWKLLDTETREHEGRQEVWQAYVNKKGGNGQKSEEVSGVDSVVILIWDVRKRM